MSVQLLRRLSQFGSLLIIFLNPIFESYKRLLYYIPKDSIGNLREVELGTINSFIKGGYFEPMVLIFDWLVGILFNNTHALDRFLGGFSGFFWSIKIGGFSFIDPLAFIQISDINSIFNMSFIIPISIPLVIALICGRVFCSWNCPYNTVQELARFIAKKLGKPSVNNQIITDPYLRYYILGTGLVLTVSGIVVFPYILPYVQLGQFLYYLTTESIFWTALIFVMLLLLVDCFIQKGAWCNYLCPTGTLLGLLGRRKIVCVQRDKKKCIENCTLCEKVCAWNAHPKFDDISDCTHCRQCIDKCSTKALKCKILKKK